MDTCRYRVSLVSVLFIASQIDYIRCALFLNSSWFSFLAISIFIVEVEFLFFFFAFYSFCFLLFLLRFFFVRIWNLFWFTEASISVSVSVSLNFCLDRSQVVFTAVAYRRLPPFERVILFKCFQHFDILIFDFFSYHIMHHIMEMDGEKMNNITSDRCLLSFWSSDWNWMNRSIDRSVELVTEGRHKTVNQSSFFRVVCIERISRATCLKLPPINEPWLLMRKRWIASWNKPELVEVTGAQEMHVRKTRCCGKND